MIHVRSPLRRCIIQRKGGNMCVGNRIGYPIFIHCHSNRFFGIGNPICLNTARALALAVGSTMASMQADRDFVRHRRFIGWGIAAFLFLIGVAIVIGAIVRAIVGPGAGVGYFPFFFFPFGFFIFVFFLFFLFRGLFWGGGGWGWRGYPIYGRDPYGHDNPAENLPRRDPSGG